MEQDYYKEIVESEARERWARDESDKVEQENGKEIDFTSMLDGCEDFEPLDENSVVDPLMAMFGGLLQPKPSKEIISQQVPNGLDDYDEEIVDERDI